MEEQPAHLRINLSTREVEIQGSELFVSKYAEMLTSMITLLTDEKEALLPTKGTDTQDTREMGSTNASTAANGTLPSTFGEYWHMFPDEITDVDRVLIAAYYVQCNSEGSSFTTKEVNQLLQDQGIKVANASVSRQRNERAKRVFRLAKGQFRVSNPGISYINDLLNPQTE